MNDRDPIGRLPQPYIQAKVEIHRTRSGKIRYVPVVIVDGFKLEHTRHFGWIKNEFGAYSLRTYWSKKRAMTIARRYATQGKRGKIGEIDVPIE